MRLVHALLLALALPAAATPVQADRFGWEAGIDVPAGAAAARVAVPAGALLASRAAGLADLRVVDAAGEPVAFAWRHVAPAAATRTASHAAYPLSRTPAPARSTAGPVQVRVQGPAGEAVWVRMGPGAEAPAGSLLPAVLFDLRQEPARLAELVLAGDLPANRPVRISAATSTDLAQWTPLALRGSLFRFDGPSGLDNRTLPLEVPQSLQGRYLRLSWDEQPGLRITALAGTVAGGAARVTAALPPPALVEGGLQWSIDAATPVAALGLATQQANSLVPVRLLARDQAGTAWRELGRTAVYRVGEAGAEGTNAPMPVGARLRHLRVEPVAAGLSLPPLAASVAFDAVEIVFLASGRAPYRLLAGQAGLPAGDVPLATLATAFPRLDELPAAALGEPRVRVPVPTPWAAWLPDTSATTLALWAVLACGVALLAFVAWRVVAQVRGEAPVPADPLNAPGTGPR